MRFPTIAIGLAGGALAWWMPHAVSAQLLTSRIEHLEAHWHLERTAADRALSKESSLVSLLVTHPREPEHHGLGLRSVAPGISVFKGSRAEARALVDRSSVLIEWPVPRYPLMDHALRSTGTLQASAEYGATGRGVILGIVDTGFDVTHPDLRNPNGKTRIAWFIDFQNPVATPRTALEEEACCIAQTCFCKVQDAAELNDLISNAINGDEPSDTYGHGTHVASLAAGNGRSDAAGRYRGVAPESTIIAARITRPNGGAILDADVILASQFIYDRAQVLGMPAVVNLSLGSNLGNHDGSSLLERALAAFVDRSQPGRAMVVAAGNSGTLLDAGGTGYPGPLGIHTEVHVPSGERSRVPVLTPNMGTAIQHGTIYVWIWSASEETLQIGLESSAGELFPLASPGSYQELVRDGLRVVLISGPNEGLRDREQQVDVPSHNALLVIDGSWPLGEVFGIVLEGAGTAKLWLESAGDLRLGNSELGAVFAGASLAGTVTIPATSPSLISVGATVNRSEWIDRTGTWLSRSDPVGTLAGFSAAGPTALGTMKPDLVAPGQYVVGAMAALADPAAGRGNSLFRSSKICFDTVDCLVIDAQHAIAQGTSMAAPMVAGAAALLLERNATLTQEQLRDLLQIGARPGVEGSQSRYCGAGKLDVSASLSAQASRDFDTTPVPKHSRFVLSDTIARPGSSVPVTGILLLRGSSGQIADGFPESDLRVVLANAFLSSPLRKSAPGLWRFALQSPPGSGGQVVKLRAIFRDEVLANQQIPIAVDRSLAERSAHAYGGCAFVAPVAGRPPPALELIVGCALYALVRLRRISHRSRNRRTPTMKPLFQSRESCSSFRTQRQRS